MIFKNNWSAPHVPAWRSISRRFLASLSLTLIWMCWPGAGTTQVPPEQFSKHVERAIHATVGILAHADTTEGQASKTHFSVRGSGVHIGKGYLLTAMHAVKKQQGGKQITPQEITILTGNLEELPAQLLGMNAFLDLAVYRLAETAPLTNLATTTFKPLIRCANLPARNHTEQQP